MKRITSVLLLVMLLLAACIVPPGQQAPGTTSSKPVDLSPAPKMAVQALSAELSVPVAQIKVANSEAVEWPDGCLGVTKTDVVCTQAIVPGFRIVLEAQGKQYEYHTNQDGTMMQAANAPAGATNPAQIASVNSLAKTLGVAETAVQLVSSKAIEWPDACLGVAQKDVVCAQVITPGYSFLFAAKGRQYEYHTNQDGSQVMPSSVQ